MYVCMYVCISINSKTGHGMKLKFGRRVAEDPRKCSAECEVDRTSGSGVLDKKVHSERTLKNGH